MSAPSTSGLSVELLLRVIDVKYGCFTLVYFKYNLVVYNVFSHVNHVSSMISFDWNVAISSALGHDNE